MRKLFIVIAVITLASCNSAKKTTSVSTAKYSLENLERMDAEKIEATYPDANLQEGTDMFEEGTEERPYTILYPGTNDELHITWQDDERTKIHDIRYTGNGRWSSETGIKIGTSYEQLNAMNGKPVAVYGFGWDYSGAVLWNDGKLEKSGVRVFLAPTGEPGNEYYGDQILEASEEELKALDLKVSMIMLNYAI